MRIQRRRQGTRWRAAAQRSTDSRFAESAHCLQLFVQSVQRRLPSFQQFSLWRSALHFTIVSDDVFEVSIFEFGVAATALTAFFHARMQPGGLLSGNRLSIHN